MPLDALPHQPAAEIQVDGVLDEPSWEESARYSGFVTVTPAPGLPASSDTQLRVLSDDKRLYVAFVAEDPQPRKVRAGLGRRDTRTDDDRVSLYVDPTGRGQRAYLFGCNARGAQIDGIRAGGDEDDLSWDGRWSCAARETEAGYIVEMAIPWKGIRHPAEVSRIGLVAQRKIARLDEISSWPALDPQASSMLGQAAVLRGPGELAVSRGLWVTPELTFGVDQGGLADDRLGAAGFGPGLTVRYAPGSSVQLLGTFNPDFSQVESDVAQVTANRRYALTLAEKRQFFLEGQEWFEHVLGDIVYTRSMVAPLYGARATIEAGPWAVAALHVLDQHPSASVSEGGGFTAREIGDAYAYETVTRVRYGYSPRGWVGLLASDRRLPDAGLYHSLGGFDTGVELGGGWVWTGAALASSTTGARRGKLAPAMQSALAHSSRNLVAQAELTWFDPGFRSENGFVVYADRIGASGLVSPRLFPGRGFVRQVALPLQAELACTTLGAPRSYRLAPEMRLFADGWRLYPGAVAEGEAFAGRWLDSRRLQVTTGGPVGRRLFLWGRLNEGTAPYYDPRRPRTGHLDRVELQIDAQAGDHLTLVLAVDGERMTERRSTLYSGYVGRLQATWFASPSVWVRATAQRSTFDATRTGELLAAWEHSPGSALYVGGQLSDRSWAVMSKLTWTLGL